MPLLKWFLPDPDITDLERILQKIEDLKPIWNLGGGLFMSDYKLKAESREYTFSIHIYEYRVYDGNHRHAALEIKGGFTYSRTFDSRKQPRPQSRLEAYARRIAKPLIKEAQRDRKRNLTAIDERKRAEKDELHREAQAAKEKFLGS
jgi:hypothetical protein